VPRRNQADNATDMNSFPFVRHHFLRAGFEIVDCPPLTSHQKNAADIRMVMDLRDYLTHATYFDEFIILSGDADFTPVLHRLRQHARRTVIYSNDHTAAAYAAICDGEVREADLIAALLDQPAAHPAAEAPAAAPPLAHTAPPGPGPSATPIMLQVAPVPVSPVPASPVPRTATAQLRIEDLRQMVMSEVVAGIRAASGPVPLEALADRAIRALGHERTVGTAWAGTGSFRELMRIALPSDFAMTEQAPYYAYDQQRHVAAPAAAPSSANLMQQREALAAAMADLTQVEPVETPLQRPATEGRSNRYTQVRPSAGPVLRAPASTPTPAQQPIAPPAAIAARATEAVMHRSAVTRTAPLAGPQPAKVDPAQAVQTALARIQEACQAPVLSPNDFRTMFACMAQEISENGLTGAQTLTAIVERAQAAGLVLRREDVRFVLDVVSEPDPWFEQGASAVLFAGRFRNFVVARCRDHGLQLSAAELDLIDTWIIGAPAQTSLKEIAPEPAAPRQAVPVMPAPAAPPSAPRDANANRWWAQDGTVAATDDASSEDDFPRIVRTRRG
jgi:hypothetical protein